MNELQRYRNALARKILARRERENRRKAITEFCRAQVAMGSQRTIGNEETGFSDF